MCLESGHVHTEHLETVRVDPCENFLLHTILLRVFKWHERDVIHPARHLPRLLPVVCPDHTG